MHAPEYVSTALFSVYGVEHPLVVTVPGNIYERIENGNGYEWYYTQFLKWAAKTSAKRCASVIAISKDMKTWWEKTGSAGRANAMDTAWRRRRPLPLRLGRTCQARHSPGVSCSCSM